MFVYYTSKGDPAEQDWLGVFLPTFLLYVVCSVFAAKKWFNTLKPSATFVLLLLMSVGMVVFYLAWVSFHVDYTEVCTPAHRSLRGWIVVFFFCPLQRGGAGMH